MIPDAILIVFISIFTALLGEGLTWLLVYRSEKYQRLMNEVEKQCKKCEYKFNEIPSMTWYHLIICYKLLVEKKKEVMADTAGKQQKKKLEREEEKLKNHNRDLSMVKMKSTFAIGIAFMALLSLFNTM